MPLKETEQDAEEELLDTEDFGDGLTEDEVEQFIRRKPQTKKARTGVDRGQQPVVKRPVGRPRKNTLPGGGRKENLPLIKKPVGRPRKNSL